MHTHSRTTLTNNIQVKWKDLVSDLNLVPTSMDYERTGAIDLGLGSLPLPFAKFKKGERARLWVEVLGGLARHV